MRTWHVGVLVATFSTIILPPNMARSQPEQENPAGFIERWTIPPARAADPVSPPEAQTPPLPRPADQAEQPDSGAGIPATQSNARARRFNGKASFYAYTRGKTASRSPHDPNGLTAAHRTLPFGTRLRVTDIETKRSVVVVVNDRGPAIRNREIDLTRGAAQALGMTGDGVAQVRIEVLTGTN